MIRNLGFLTYTRKMGKRKYIDKIMELFEKSPVVDYSSIERIITDKNRNTDYAKLLISNLIKQGKIKRLTKGYYTIHDEISIAVFCIKPAYIGLQSALSMHGLWEQETIPIIITTTKTRVGIREIFNNNIYIRRLDKKHFFGYSYIQDGTFYMPYSDIEKTFIDMITFKQQITPETLQEIKKKIDKKKLRKYLENYSEKTRKETMKKIQ
jgi:predicted transcriptional regulator of viral defense system